MNKIRIFLSMLSLLTLLAVKANANSHWICNPRDFQYDMTLLLDLHINDQLMTNRNNYEIAAFCGEECRGVATVVTAGEGRSDYYSLRVRSNVTSKEKISFRVYDKTANKEYKVGESITFESQKLLGMPSSPKVLKIRLSYQVSFMLDDEVYMKFNVEYGDSIVVPADPKREGYVFSGWRDVASVMPDHDVSYSAHFIRIGDLNDDGVIDVTDITALVNIILNLSPVQDEHEKTVADVNMDGVIDVTDISGVVDIILHQSNP